MSNSNYVAYIKNLGNTIALYWSGINCPIGIIFNILSAWIFFTNKNLNKIRMGYQYGMLSSIDALSVATDYFLIYFLPNLSPLYSLRLVSNTACKLTYYIIRIVPHASSFVQMYITIDRYIDIKYPNRFKFLNRTRTINFIILGIFLVCSLVDIPNLFYFLSVTTTTTTTLIYYNKTAQFAGNNSSNRSNESEILMTTFNSTSNALSCSSTNSILFAADIISAAMRTWIPLILIVITSGLTIRIIFKSKERVNANSTNRTSQSSYNRKERQFTITVISLNAIFFILNFPLSVSWVLSDTFRYVTTASAELTANLNFYNIISILLAYLYHSLTFFINYTFNSIFRREVLIYLGRCFHVQKWINLNTSTTQHHEVSLHNSKIAPTATGNNNSSLAAP